MPQTPVTSLDVLAWPEFRELAKKLGINLDLITTQLVIDLRVGYMARVVHEFQGENK